MRRPGSAKGASAIFDVQASAGETTASWFSAGFSGAVNRLFRRLAGRGDSVIVTLRPAIFGSISTCDIPARSSRTFSIKLHAEFLMRHFAAAKLQLHPHLVPLVEKLFAVPDLRQVIVIVDVYPELDFLQLGSGRLFILLLLGDVVTELSEIDDLADRRVGGWRDFDQIEAETLSFAQGVRQLHDAELFAGGCDDDPDFSGANPTVYTNLWLQIRIKLLAGETGVNRIAVFPFIAIPGATLGKRPDTPTSPRLRFTATKSSH